MEKLSDNNNNIFCTTFLLLFQVDGADVRTKYVFVGYDCF